MEILATELVGKVLSCADLTEYQGLQVARFVSPDTAGMHSNYTTKNVCFYRLYESLIGKCLELHTKKRLFLAISNPDEEFAP